MDNEVKGEGNSVNYKYRMHDPRLGRFFAVDPLAPMYPELTPYQFSSNRPIDYIELEGLEGVPIPNYSGLIETYGVEYWGYPKGPEQVDEGDPISGAVQDFLNWEYAQRVERWEQMDAQEKVDAARMGIYREYYGGIAKAALEPVAEAFNVYTMIGGTGGALTLSGGVLKTVNITYKKRLHTYEIVKGAVRKLEGRLSKKFGMSRKQVLKYAEKNGTKYRDKKNW